MNCFQTGIIVYYILGIIFSLFSSEKLKHVVILNLANISYLDGKRVLITNISIFNMFDFEDVLYFDKILDLSSSFKLVSLIKCKIDFYIPYHLFM